MSGSKQDLPDPMAVDRTTLVFFDASCLVAAADSPSGGSGYVYDLCRRGLLRAGISGLVWAEAELAIQKKFPPERSLAFERMREGMTFVLAPGPSHEQLAHFQGVVNAKDLHVLVAALTVEADYLLTLDQPFTRELARAQLPVRGISPGEFILDVLPGHTEAHLLRD